MAHKTITLSIEEVCGVETIVADPPFLLMKNKNHKINFSNEIDVKAEVRFYKYDEKGEAVISDFCPELETSGELAIDSGLTVDCKPPKSGNYAYTVEAPPYPPLDPIIIIEDSLDFPGVFLFSLLPAGIVLPVVAVVGAAAGYLGCRTMMRKQAQ